MYTYIYPYFQWYNYRSCKQCGGNGVSNGYVCFACNGTGWQRTNPPAPNPIPPPQPAPPLPAPAKWVPRCTCGTGNSPTTVCPVHPNKTY